MPDIRTAAGAQPSVWVLKTWKVDPVLCSTEEGITASLPQVHCLKVQL